MRICASMGFKASILTINCEGLKVNQSSPIDELTYNYEANSNKLQKIVTDNTVSPSKITTTNYCDGFVYQSSSPSGGDQVGADTLQYILTGEGRLRPDSSSGLPAGGFTYDYFLRDHLGDVRSVITEQTSEETYAATMESQNATVENQLFDNVSTTQYPTPPGFNNPVDTSNHYVSMLDGSAGNNSVPRVGPAIVLKVMAGDTVTIATQAWYQGVVHLRKVQYLAGHKYISSTERYQSSNLEDLKEDISKDHPLKLKHNKPIFTTH